jgi:hypothetical protein
MLEEQVTVIEDTKGEVPTSGSPNVSFTNTKMIELAGVPCLVSDMKAQYTAGTLRHIRFYLLGKGDVMYSLFTYSTADRWAQDEALLESIAESFVILE